ncbi:MAG: hypothetical protein GFH27_549311n138 [Chloroflexi bacterium AL-W]|nr:hypothetical protein [Chloroflexi bacterium AL-N1]NOK68684.1 hypothetical protein [Chloroflexi bacterium AL-N10]NOK76170.1 hypothetical protein [Chloroflexi bacterium AL-N5]NOK84193.1 hypothetical protein [Chloroflexi bacterium AL-W]NOK91308.1 hypothetical protein [Chloroflexi bacterium AL-N15]
MNYSKVIKNRRWRIVYMAISFVWILMMFGATPASASSTAPDRDKLVDRILNAGPNAATEYAEMTPEEQAVVNEAFKTTREEVSIEITPATHSLAESVIGSSCKDATATVEGRSLVARTYLYRLEIEWCYNGSIVTEIKRDQIIAEVGPTPFWFYDGEVNSQTSGGVNDSQYFHYTQGKFSYCPIPAQIGCLQSVQPWVELTVKGDGTVSRRTSA